MSSLTIYRFNKLKNKPLTYFSLHFFYSFFFSFFFFFIFFFKRYKTHVDNFDVPNINWKEVRPYLALEHFNVQAIEAKNRAAAGLCAWVVNIVKYHDTIVSVEPKRQALSEANARLAAANEKLEKVNAHV